MSSSQPGWYRDEQRPGGLRWWDGAQWTEHRSAPPSSPGYAHAAGSVSGTDAPYSTTNFAELKAPDGTNWNTPWIWLIIVAPLISYPLIFMIDWAAFFDFSTMADPRNFDPSSYLSGVGYASIGYIGVLAVSWAVWGLTVWLCIVDFRELLRRDVPRPFHWAWVFLGSSVYVIGRSVVARRRIGRGISPMWAEIASIVISMVLLTYLLVIVIAGVVTSLMDVIESVPR